MAWAERRPAYLKYGLFLKSHRGARKEPRIKGERRINAPLPTQHVWPFAGIAERSVCGDGRGRREKPTLTEEGGFFLLWTLNSPRSGLGPNLYHVGHPQALR